MKKLFLFLALVSLILFNSCSNDNDDPVIATNNKFIEKNAVNTDRYLTNFASILSKATYNRKDVREFLKNESSKQFDKNYDVLYYMIKDEKIGNETFQEILASYSSIETINEIESNVPLLNILIPEISFFDIKAENMPLDDKEIPVAISKTSKTSLFLNGEEVVGLEKGEVPSFHVFVVNENSRVIVPSNQSNGLKSGGPKTIQFKSPNYDGSIVEASTKSAIVGYYTPGTKAIEAFQYFNKDDGSNAQMAFQRDYIYYGITPQKPSGSLNRSVSEYISFIEVNPLAYFKIADQIGTGSNNDDPYILQWSTSQKKRELTQAELIDRLWTKGAYDFKFEIVMSTNQQPQIVHIPLKPDQIWNFNLDHSYRHSTMFRRSKHTYWIDPNKFTSKRVYLTDKQISFAKWNIAEESIYRYINISEEDESLKTTTTHVYETTRVLTNKFKGDVKLEIGLGNSDKISGSSGAEVSNSNSIRENKTVTLERLEKSDDLGSIRIYFYDPIIEAKFGRRLVRNNRYMVRTYTNGFITFALSVR